MNAIAFVLDILLLAGMCGGAAGSSGPGSICWIFSTQIVRDECHLALDLMEEFRSVMVDRFVSDTYQQEDYEARIFFN